MKIKIIGDVTDAIVSRISLIINSVQQLNRSVPIVVLLDTLLKHAEEIEITGSNVSIRVMVAMMKSSTLIVVIVVPLFSTLRILTPPFLTLIILL